MENLKKIGKARKQILKGNTDIIFKKQFIIDVTEIRLNICKTCKYDFYDKDCNIENISPCCGACGCSLKDKLRVLSEPCGAIKLGYNPLWLPVLNKEQEMILKEEISKEK